MMTKYSDDFQDESVRLVLEGERTTAEAARELEISVWTLRDWVKKHPEQTRHYQPARRENVVLRQERKILEKAAAYFAKGQL